MNILHVNQWGLQQHFTMPGHGKKHDSIFNQSDYKILEMRYIIENIELLPFSSENLFLMLDKRSSENADWI